MGLRVFHVRRGSLRSRRIVMFGGSSMRTNACLTCYRHGTGPCKSCFPTGGTCAVIVPPGWSSRGSLRTEKRYLDFPVVTLRVPTSSSSSFGEAPTRVVLVLQPLPAPALGSRCLVCLLVAFRLAKRPDKTGFSLTGIPCHCTMLRFVSPSLAPPKASDTLNGAGSVRTLI